MKSPVRIAISVAITVFWLVMMSLLVRDYLLQGRQGADLLDVGPETLAEQWRDYEEWMRLQVGPRSQGISYTSIRRHYASEGYLACNRIWLELALLGEKVPFRLETVAFLDSSFHLLRARAHVSIDQSELTFQALTTTTQLLYRIEYEGNVRAGSQTLTAPISLFEAVRPLAARRLDLKPGKKYRLAVLDSTWSLRQGVAEVTVQPLEEIRIGGEMRDAYRLLIQLGSMVSNVWVSPGGEILRREFANNIVMEQIKPQKAREDFPGIDAQVEPPAIGLSDFTGEGAEGATLDGAVGPLNLLRGLFSNPGR